MLITISQQLMAQMESLVVDLVRDLRIGLRPRRAQKIRTADLAVTNLWEFRAEEKGESDCGSLDDEDDCGVSFWENGTSAELPPWLSDP